jgi:WD40 repeat protein
VVLLAVGFAMLGGSPRGKPMAGPPPIKSTQPSAIPNDRLPPPSPPAEAALNPGGAPPAASAGLEPDSHLGNQRLGSQTFGATGGLGFGANSKRGGASAAGASPSRSFSVASGATILVSTGGKVPILLGEKQAFTNEAVLHVWDWSESDKSRPLEVSAGSFAVSPDGKWIVTTKGEKIEIATGKVTMLPDFEPQANRTLFSRDGRRLALLIDGNDNTWIIRIVEFAGGKKLCEIAKQWPAMWPAAFGPDGSEIFSMGRDNFVRRFDAVTGKELQKYEPAHENSVRKMLVSPSGKLLVSGGSRGDILLWEVASGKLLHKLVVEPPVYADAGVYSLAFSPDETQVVGGGIGSVLLWSVATGQVKKFPRASAGAEDLRFSADGKTITAVSGFHGTAGPAGEDLLVFPTVSKWDVADAR